VGVRFATKVKKIKNKVYPAFFIIFLKEAGLSFQNMQEFSFSDVTHQAEAKAKEILALALASAFLKSLIHDRSNYNTIPGN
jgi:hypothetical protein